MADLSDYQQPTNSDGLDEERGYTQGKGGDWDGADMLAIMIEIATTSIKALASDLFNQMVLKSDEQGGDD